MQLKIELESSSLTGDSRRREQPHHQQAHDQHQRAHRRRRHRRAGWFDPGQRHPRRATRALSRPHSGDWRAVQDAQPPDATKTNLMVFIRPKILRDGFATGDRDQREVQLHPRKSSAPRCGPRPKSCRCCPSARSRCCRRSRAPLPDANCPPPHAHGQSTPRHNRLQPPPHRRRRHAAQAMNEVAAPEVIRPQRVGFAFAKRHGSARASACMKASPSACIDQALAPLAVAEVRRYLGIPLRLEKVEDATFDSLLRAGLRSRQRRHAGRRRRRGIHRPRAPRAGSARTGRPARERRRRAHHPA